MGGAAALPRRSVIACLGMFAVPHSGTGRHDPDEDPVELVTVTWMNGDADRTKIAVSIRNTTTAEISGGILVALFEQGARTEDIGLSFTDVPPTDAASDDCRLLAVTDYDVTTSTRWTVTVAARVPRSLEDFTYTYHSKRTYEFEGPIDTSAEFTCEDVELVDAEHEELADDAEAMGEERAILTLDVRYVDGTVHVKRLRRETGY
ncbi:hypothetical protein ACFQGT_18155 [Natrialbaceae archaeon GCM10025810]|uniref:hypothetical protein n=1 Tax=Halovalidus salilacus TaxID=3075124 RepID=UPI0036237BA9